MSEPTISLAAYAQCVGKRVGTSRWFDIGQQRVDQFAEVTEDPQFIHVDPAAAATTPFGGTIAHGFLLLALMTAMANSALPAIAGTNMAINYGLNAVRFLSPVRTGRRVRGVFVLKQLNERSPGQWQSVLQVTVEIEGETKPALAAEWVALTFVDR